MLPHKRIAGVSIAKGSLSVVFIEKPLLSGEWRIIRTLQTENRPLAVVFKQNGFRPEEIAVSSATTEVVRPLTLPGSATDKLEQMAKYEVQDLFPRKVDVAYAQAALGAARQGIRAIVAAVEKEKLRREMAGLMDDRGPDAIVTEGLAIYQVLRADGALGGRTAVVYTGEGLAAVMHAEDGEVRFLRSYVVPETPDLAGEIVKMIEHVQKKYACLPDRQAGVGVERLLFVGKDRGEWEAIAAKFPSIKNEIYAHSQIKEPEYLPALGAALSLLPEGVGLNFVSKEERKARAREKSKKMTAALVALPAVLMLLAANLIHLVYQAKGRDVAKRVYQAKEDISKIERDLWAAQAVYEENRSMMDMIRENDAALGHSARWSEALSDLAALVPSEVTLENITTDGRGGGTKEDVTDKPAGRRKYVGMHKKEGDEKGTSEGKLKISIEGFAYDFTTVNRFFSNLEGSPRFREVKPMFEMGGDMEGGRISVDERVRFHVEMAVAETGDMAMEAARAGGDEKIVIVDAVSINYEGLANEP